MLTRNQRYAFLRFFIWWRKHSYVDTKSKMCIFMKITHRPKISHADTKLACHFHFIYWRCRTQNSGL